MKESANSRYKFIPWDFDRCFERDTDVGLYGNNAIIKKLFQNDSAFNLYKSELENMLNTIYTNENVDMILDDYVSKVRDAYNIDPFLGDGVYNFDKEVQDLKEYIANRRQFFFDQLPTFTKPTKN